MATSLFTNLTNKVWYNVQNAVTDPKANAFAEQQKQIAEEQKQKKEQKAKEEADAKATEEYGDPNTFSAKRIFAKVGSQTWYILKQVINPFFALMIAMIIANDMIVYSVPIRIIFFIFTFLLCYTLPFITILIGIFYLLKGGYSYFVNNMSNGPKQYIMPRIFTLLPITTHQPTTALGAFFLYPFTYPKSEIGRQHLPKIKDNYWDTLVKSFKGFDAVQNMAPFTEAIEKAKESVEYVLSAQPKVLPPPEATPKATETTIPINQNLNTETPK